MTNLFDLKADDFPTTAASVAPPNDFAAAPPAEEDSPYDDAPMAPSNTAESHSFDDVFASLPPVDQDVLDAAAPSVSEGSPFSELTSSGGFSTNSEDFKTSTNFQMNDSAPSETTSPGVGEASVFSNMSSDMVTDRSSDMNSALSSPAISSGPTVTTNTAAATNEVKLPPVVSAIKQNLEQIRNYSDKLSPSTTNIPANVPFSIRIEGKLELHEQERLLEILSRETLGIRTVEIEPQLAAGRILLPRISEYAGVQIAQALRNAKVDIRLGESEKIFFSEGLKQDDDALFTPKAPNYVRKMVVSSENSEEMLITTDSEVPGHRIKRLLDTFQATINLRAIHVHSANSTFFQESLENIKKQLRLKAYHKGADALIRFKTELFPVDDNSQYKLLAEAVAVQVEQN